MTFDEPLAGIDAADLLVEGTPASSMSGSGAGPYVFRFPARPEGATRFTWREDHGIRDLSPAQNAFSPEPWSYDVDPNAEPPEVVISEILVTNLGTFTDEDRDRSDWIEIENRTDAPVNLGGWSLTDDRGDADKWIFPNVEIGAGEFRIVFASGKDRRDPESELHSNFRLSRSGEYLALHYPDETRQFVAGFAPEFPEQRPDFSYGLDSEGAASYFEDPTPGEANDSETRFPGFAEPPQFSVDHGLYEEAFELELTTTTPGARIFYTLDGKEPTAERGTEYTGPIAVAGQSNRAVVTVRATSFHGSLLPSKTATQSYIFTEHVLTQPARPTGFPTRWGAAPGVDYEMDQQIVGVGNNAELVEQGLRSLPIVSIVTDVEHIFGTRGIYSNSQGEGIAWERPTSVELIWPDGREGFQVDSGVRMLGGASRNPDRSPKHSFRLLFKSDYGPSKLRYPLVPDSPVDSFDTLVLRANYNNSWIHWDSGQRARCQHIRDQFMKDTVRD
ncbi:MAG: lamin tail domain-containing protein, partial [Planctomycetota bacterium]